MKYYITGDTHRDLTRIVHFIENNHTTIEDVFIILGDAGINYYLNESDIALKEELSKLNITLFCIQGNHEARPWECGNYEQKEWKEGIVYVEKQYPNLLFGKDGEVYNFNGNKVIVIGGAYSVDKYYRLQNHMKWFKSEQPSVEIKRYVVTQLEKYEWDMDIILTHTVPYYARPTECFLSSIDQSTVDNTTENFLQEIYQQVSFKKWYAGHFHIDIVKDCVQILYHSIEQLV